MPKIFKIAQSLELLGFWGFCPKMSQNPEEVQEGAKNPPVGRPGEALLREF